MFISVFFILNVIFCSQEDIFEQSYSDETNIELLNTFEYYKENPIVLSETDIIELQNLPFIDESTAKSILDTFKVYPNLKVKELLRKMNLGRNQKYILSKTIIAEETLKYSFDYRSRYYNRLNPSKGFQEGDFKGNNVDLFSRGNANYNNMNLNFSLNKNAGELNWIEGYNLSFSYLTKKLKVILGDYKIRKGYGLVNFTSQKVRKSPAATSLYNLGQGIIPSRSNYVFSQFKGIALESNFKLGNYILNTTIFYSNRNLPATIDSNGRISSFYQPLVFRTDNEIAKKDALNERIYGLNVEIRSLDKFVIGLNNQLWNYNRELDVGSKSFYNQKVGYINSIYVNLPLSTEKTIKGEIALDNKGEYGANLNFVNNKYNSLIGLRILSNNFRSQYSNIFSEFTNGSNEIGLYYGSEFKWNRITNNFYIDYFSNIEKSDNFNKIDGFEILNDVVFNVEKTHYNFRVRFQNKKDISLNDEKDRLIINYKRNLLFRGELKQEITKNFDLKFRTDLNLINYDSYFRNETGILSLVEANYRYNDILETSLRYVFYKTDSFSSTIYHFEYLVNGYMLSSPLYGNGNKILFLIKLNLEPFTISIRYTSNLRNDLTSIGSGYDEIFTNVDDRIYFQIDYKMKKLIED